MKKNVIVTGASGNLGSAMVKRLLQENHHVIATTSPGRSSSFTIAGDVSVVEVNLTDEAASGNFITQIVTRYKTIDAAILLVGAFAPGGIAETDGAALKKMYSVNFESAFFAARPVFRQMIQQPSGGRMVLIGARPALQPADGKNALAYALSKSLLFHLAECLNEEGARHRVVTSVVVPGVIDTPPNRQAMPNADFSTWVKPEAIADNIAYLISDTAAPIVNPVLRVYGNG
jgi:NAD(P)-dependent dehydrogenase (short-subunit alcohol dehydrogenase family)